MSKVWIVVISLVFAVLLAGTGFLAIWEIPAPKVEIEKVLPNDRFPN